VPIGVAMLANQCMFMFEMIRRVFADSISLSWISFNANIGVECVAFAYKFQNVAFSHV